jgi:4-hydroxybenzoate polyprenyltransferase
MPDIAFFKKKKKSAQRPDTQKNTEATLPWPSLQISIKSALILSAVFMLVYFASFQRLH